MFSLRNSRNRSCHSERSEDPPHFVRSATVAIISTNKKEMQYSMKILYVAGLSPKESSLYRLWALERLGHQVVPFNTFDYLPRNPLVRKVAHRLSAGPTVNRLNRDLLRIAEAEKPDL